MPKSCALNYRMACCVPFSTSHRPRFARPAINQSTSNDFPNLVKSLSSVEERMVSPYTPFMQIRPLMIYADNGQLGMKGSVVNISIEIDDAINVLPRQFNKMQTIQVKLKLHMGHKSDYIFETIRPSNVCGALKYLLETPLYKKYANAFAILVISNVNIFMELSLFMERLTSKSNQPLNLTSVSEPSWSYSRQQISPYTYIHTCVHIDVTYIVKKVIQYS